jgi:hypothetical protein
VRLLFSAYASIGNAFGRFHDLRRAPRSPTFGAVTDRLNELRRQRDLVRQHLDWLEAEIASASGAKSAPPAKATAPQSTTPHHPPASDPDAEALLQRYGTESGDSAAKVKLGCWVVFAGSFVLLGLAIAAWFILRAR